uniref:PHD and RING finger domain-containing protein 1 n=1 Tax=Davidia involucrata TaxID=16924 RepID=A0A5B7AI60_DAVIN
MGRGGELGNKQGVKRRVRLKEKDSDESDDDYMVGEDEECEESDEYCSSFAGDDSEESLGEFEVEEEEEKVRKVVRSKGQKGFPGRKKNGVKKPGKKKRVSYEDEDDEDDDDDEEFMPDEIDCTDDEDELTEMKNKKKVGRRPFREKGIVKGWKRKRKRNSKVMKKPTRKKGRKNCGLGRKSTVGNDFTGKNPILKQRNKKSSGRRRLRAPSDADFVSSGSSDFEYTISEEEREQMREANEFCRSLTASLRSSSSSKILQEGGVLCQKRKRSGRKGKEKVEDLKNEVGKQVCGICFSEEEKKIVRGTLNCCSHYFCFACIMEWSKVESRCPLCKQRFVTISKPARSNAGFDLRTMVIDVPERDQVYQPSEEELRGYLDPYESVICTECQQGGDDALMLLCDLCDSPAHTYCVGLGREVPEGNWYCEGCRPTALASSTPQAPNPTPDQRTSNNLTGGSSPVDSVGEGLDLNLMYVPDTPLTQGTRAFSSRRPVRDFQAASPVSGVWAFTVSERRRIQRQIHNLLNNRMSQLGSRANDIPATHLGNNIFGSQMDRGREIANQHTITPERVAPRDTFFEGRLQDNPTHFVQNRDTFSSRLSNLRGQVIQGPTSTSTDGSVNGMLQAETPGINMAFNSRSGYEPLHPCSSRTSVGSDTSMSPYMYREVSHLNVAKEQVQSMVRSHLRSLSRDVELGYSTFKDIARSSTHTILAACGLEHLGSEVYPVQPPLICNHVEQMAVGQTSLMKGHCLSCFDLFVRDVVREIMKTRMPPWFRC